VAIYGRFFGTWFSADDFLFSVKELGFLTNLGDWIRVLDVVCSYMYIVLQTIYDVNEYIIYCFF
jgi:hypothetical protein